jgi:hypothetical protein
MPRGSLTPLAPLGPPPTNRPTCAPHVPEGPKGRRGQGCRGQPLIGTGSRPGNPFRTRLQAQDIDRQAALSFDYLVGACQKGGRNSDAERLCHFEVDRQLDFRGSLHRQVGRLLAAENSTDVVANHTEFVEGGSCVKYEAPSCEFNARGIDPGIARRAASAKMRSCCSMMNGSAAVKTP